MVWNQEQAARYQKSAHGEDGSLLDDPLDLCLRMYSSGASVLDGGCGTGRFSLKALEYGAANVVAIDISPSMLKQANELLAQQKKVGMARVAEGDVCDLPDDYFQKFHVYISVNVGCNIGSLDSKFANAKKILIPGGRFIVTGPDNLDVLYLKRGVEPNFATSEIERIIQENGPNGLKDLDYVLRATIDNRGPGGAWRLVNTVEIPGMQIKRKIPGLVVDNVWHTSREYDHFAVENGFEIEASFDPTLPPLGPLTEVLGEMYRYSNPFFVRVYRKN